MNFIAELLFEPVVTLIADGVGRALSVSGKGRRQSEHTAKRVAFTILAGVLSWTPIIAVGVAAWFLFLDVHPALGIIVAAADLLLIVLFFSVAVKLAKKNRHK